jgi:hypothetical protein
MEPTSHPDPLTVAIIVERDAAERILEFADRVHVWAVDTPVNRQAAELVWRRREGTRNALSMTVFIFDELSSDRIVARQLATIELHHDKRSQVPAWSRALVFGAAPSPLLTEEFLQFGFQVLPGNESGFTAIRCGDAG